MLVKEREIVCICPLMGKEVKITEGYVPTTIGIKIPQRGCQNERKCPYRHDKQCFAYEPR